MTDLSAFKEQKEGPWLKQQLAKCTCRPVPSVSRENRLEAQMLRPTSDLLSRGPWGGAHPASPPGDPDARQGQEAAGLEHREQ